MPIKLFPMKKDDISRLLQRYLSAREMGKEPYFDADEVMNCWAALKNRIIMTTLMKF